MTARRGPITPADYDVRDEGFTSPCWVWRGHTSSNEGYGRLSGRGVRAHRVMYEQEVGPIPEGLQIDHLCRVRACVNPAHLEPVKHVVNALRGARTKLSDADRDAIRNDPRRHREIAADYGVHRMTIGYVKRSPHRERAWDA